MTLVEFVGKIGRGELPEAPDRKHRVLLSDGAPPPGQIEALPVPGELFDLWSFVIEIRLYEDEQMRHGLVVWGPRRVASLYLAECGELEVHDQYRPGDLVIGEFLGSTTRLIMRCEPSDLDFGTVLVALASDPRGYWPPPWPNLEAFLADFVDHRGETSWP